MEEYIHSCKLQSAQEKNIDKWPKIQNKHNKKPKLFSKTDKHMEQISGLFLNLIFSIWGENLDHLSVFYSRDWRVPEKNVFGDRVLEKRVGKRKRGNRQ